MQRNMIKHSTKQNTEHWIDGGSFHWFWEKSFGKFPIFLHSEKCWITFTPDRRLLDRQQPLSNSFAWQMFPQMFFPKGSNFESFYPTVG